MKYYDKMLQVSGALQNILFAPRNALSGTADASWRIMQFKKNMENGVYASLQDGESSADAAADGRRPLSDESFEGLKQLALKCPSDLVLKFHAMQLLAYLLNGGISATVHDSDFSDALISEAMLYSASLRLDKPTVDKVVEIVDKFAVDIEAALSKEFPYSTALSSDERSMLKYGGLWTKD